MLNAVITSLSLVSMTVLLFVLLVFASEFGTWLGQRSRARGEDRDASSMATAALGLLALLIAFSYSMAVARYDLRRQVVLEEANAIGSTVNFALMLPDADRAPIVDDLRRYTELRLALGAPYAPNRLEDDIALSSKLQGGLWTKAVAVSRAAPDGLPGYRFIMSLNEMNNVGEKRITALRNHVPVVILLMLAGTAGVALGFAGYSAGAAGIRRRVGMAVMSLLVAMLISLTQDLQRPDRGTVEVSTQPLRDALAAIPPD